MRDKPLYKSFYCNYSGIVKKSCFCSIMSETFKYSNSLKSHKMRRYAIIIIFCMFALLATPALASYTEEWGEYQDDQTNRGFVNDLTGHYEDTGTTFTASAGTDDRQPIIASLNGSSDQYILITEGNYLRAYDDTLTLIDEITANPSTPLTLTEISNNTYILLGNTTNALAYQWNGTNFIISDNQSLGGRNWTGSAVKCRPNNSTACYFVDTHSDVCEWAIGTGLTCSTAVNESAENANTRYPAIADIDRDGSDELVFQYNNTLMKLAVYDLVSDNLDTSFSADGLQDLTACNAVHNYGSNPMLINVDGAGDTEIVIGKTGATSGTSSVCLEILRSDGTAYPNFPVAYNRAHANAIDWTRPSSLATCDFGNVHYDFCLWGKHYKTTAGNAPITDMLACWNENGTQTVSIDTDWLDFAVGDTEVPGLACADMDADGQHEIVTTKAIYEDDDTTLVNLSGSTTSYQLALGDVNSDNELDIILSLTSSTLLAYSNFSNDPPTLNNSLSFGGYFNYYNPVCVNTTITFQAQETGGLITGNYVNDGSSDTERIATNCGQDEYGVANTDPDTFMDNGTFDLSNPTFDCYYNVTGSFPVRLYLQDEFNTEDYSQYNTNLIPLTVIDGIPGVTCNVPSSFIGDSEDQTVIDDDPNGIDESIDSTMGALLGSTTKVRLVAGTGISLACGIRGAQLAGVIGFVGGTILCFIMTTFIGLMPAWIFVLFLIAMILLLIFAKFIVGGGGGGTQS